MALVLLYFLSSFSMMCYEIISRQKIYHGCWIHYLEKMIEESGSKFNVKLLNEVRKAIENSDDASDFPIFEELSDLMEKCRCFEPESRLTMEQGKILLLLCLEYVAA